jgi:hypothetical protein
MRHAYGHANGDAHIHSDGDSDGDSHFDSYPYAYGSRFAKPDAQLLARLHHGDYHWHGNRGRHRYRQPLR